MRQVTPEQSAQLARLIQACGLDDNPNADRIASVIRSTTRVTLVEQAGDGALIGFIDAFMTVSFDGNPRWEVDLLGVHPAFRGRGIAQRLIKASVQAAHEQGVNFIRALIHVDNAASANAFQRCGFRGVGSDQALYISDQPADAPLTPSTSAHLIPVCTLTYTGIWVEHEFTPETLLVARAIRAKYDWFIAGVLFPARRPLPAEGYVSVGRYRWWLYGVE